MTAKPPTLEEAKRAFWKANHDLPRTTEAYMRAIAEAVVAEALERAGKKEGEAKAGRDEFCYCDGYISGGVPCPPGKCPNAPKPGEIAVSQEPSSAPETCTCGTKPWNPLRPFSHREDCPIAGGKCRGCEKPLLKANRNMADGCPCNAPRGVNHGLVPGNVCTCVECDPEQTGSVRAATPPAEERAKPSGGVGPSDAELQRIAQDGPLGKSLPEERRALFEAGRASRNEVVASYEAFLAWLAETFEMGSGAMLVKSKVADLRRELAALKGGKA